MIISIVTLFPELYDPFFKTSLIKRAVDKGYIKANIKNMFDYAQIKERIDSPAFGPGTGMLIKPDIVEKAIEEQQNCYGQAYKIFFSPQGKKLDQNLLQNIICQAKNKDHIMLLPARYEGMDSRVEDYYSDCTISIGDYVLMGGDLPAMVLIEGLLRLIPGIISKEESVAKESFSGAFVDYPSYTAPVIWKNIKVPDIIRSGNHKQIFQWRQEMAAKKTVLCHFEWLRNHASTSDDINLAKKFIPPHYIVLMHSDVILESGKEGTSSVTSLDIHDIARSACTFGLKKYFIVTPLLDQQKITQKLLNFWLEEKGISYNISRHKAIKNVILLPSINDVIAEITKIEGKEPILIGTTARLQENNFKAITYYDQEKVWSNQRPVLFVLGTARGLSSSILSRCDYIIEPIKGFSDYNHLSVRSAAATIFDRWLGINLKK